MALRTGKSKFDYDTAWHLFLAGATLPEVAELCNIPIATLTGYSSSHHWGARRTQAGKYALRSIRDDLAKRIEQHRVTHQHFMLDQLTHVSNHIERVDIGKDKDSGEVEIIDKLQALDMHDRITRRVTGMEREEERDPLELGFAMLVAAGRLVNENHQQEDFTDLDASQVSVQKTTEAVEDKSIETENNTASTSSAILPLPTHLGAFTGILRSANGHPDASPSDSGIPPETPETPISGQNEQSGAKWEKNPEYDKATHEYDPETGQLRVRKPSDYQTPKPLVNEDDHQATDTGGDSQAGEEGTGIPNPDPAE